MPFEADVISPSIVALFDRHDANHQRTVDFLADFSGTLYSTLAVFTEVMYLLDFSTQAQQAFLRWAAGGAVRRVDFDDAHFQRIVQLHARYADVPMDFADATLIAAAERLELREILTFDKDFRIYRYRRRQLFKTPMLDQG